ncbi:Zasp-like motif domain-containing protein [Caenorhabditis elegans]|uniref:Zasp-like motif domain-containing protein n=2 Tax=Caenorhabditis elegans TaxID=6239 RepID=V6CLW0_CAEEL|nr:Zasp-like motif domain-containing protein [Caenorhabditis elegans]CDK13547.1 Zasp-like motif domain-containing protein [Caenorhabditis elegans]|eukprot:NP_001293807.1 Prion-like-(Q/N-rich)-domain-bearing protein [Caenorhabditis elegans]
MTEVCGVNVPPAIAPLFSLPQSSIDDIQNTSLNSIRSSHPFSYTKPTPGGPKLHNRIKCPRVVPRSFWLSFEEDEELDVPLLEPEMPQTVHLQYNSPMGLYSKEAAVEQFQQQIGETPNDLPAQEKHFDPSKSATLKYLKEGERENFGENFFEKVAQAEAPRVPYQSEPNWARTAREKSERARSKTPADPHTAYRPASSPAPANHPVHAENAREHAEKSKVFTHNINEPFGRSYWEASNTVPRYGRSHSVGRELYNRGYELGGMDYTGGIHVDHGTDYQYYEEPARKPQTPKLPPGYELGGTDFYKGHVPGDANYRGHGPDPPRLRPKYTADSHDPCNVAIAPNLEGVDANLLVGDTLSNQKIRHEVRHIDQTKFGTSFGPTKGFSYDHHTVPRYVEPPKPVVYSLSANKSLARSASVPRSSAPPEQRDVWNIQQSEVDKETYITEPNWRRNVDQRRLAWERRAFETEQHLSRPYSEKVAPGVPPAWHAEAQHKHQQWQQQADNMNTQNYTYSTTGYQPSQPSGGQQSYNETRQYSSNATSNYPSQTQQYQQQQHQYQSDHSNAQRLLNSGYNTNQVDYVLGHKDKYNEGPHYQPPIINSSATAANNSSSSTHHYNSSSQAIPLGGPNQGHSSSSYTTETRVTGGGTGAPVSNNYSNQNYSSSAYNSQSSQHQTKSIPVQNYQISFPPLSVSTPAFGTSFFENSQKSFQESSEKFHRDLASPLSRTIPVQSAGHFSEVSKYFNSEETNHESRQESRCHSEVAETTETSEKKEENYQVSQPAIPLPSADQVYESSNYNKSYSSQTTTQHQPQPVAANNNYSTSYHTERSSTTTAQQPQTIALPPPQNNSSHTETHSSTGPIMMHSPGGHSMKSTEFSSSRHHKQETTTTTTTTPQPPVFQTTTYPTTKTTSYNYSSSTIPSQPAKPSFNQESYTTHTERNNSSQGFPQQRLQPSGGYSYENYSSSRKEENRREETSRPVSQLSQYSESRNYKRNYEEKTETTTVPSLAPATNVTYKDLSNAQCVDDVFNKKTEMNESLPVGSVFNTHNNTEGGYRDANGHDVSYKRETQTSADPGRETALLKEEEKRVVETPLEPGVISRHVTTKYYKKKTVTDTTTTTA